jgi:hypothetical protein
MFTTDGVRVSSHLQQLRALAKALVCCFHRRL